MRYLKWCLVSKFFLFITLLKCTIIKDICNETVIPLYFF